MSRAAILILAGADTHSDLGRLVNGLVAAKEFKERGDDIKVIFDGGSTAWLHKLIDPEHPAHRLFQQVHEAVEGACQYCAGAFHATEAVRQAKVALLDEYEGHPSIAGLLVAPGRRGAALGPA